MTNEQRFNSALDTAIQNAKARTRRAALERTIGRLVMARDKRVLEQIIQLYERT